METNKKCNKTKRVRRISSFFLCYLQGIHTIFKITKIKKKRKGDKYDVIINLCCRLYGVWPSIAGYGSVRRRLGIQHRRHTRRTDVQCHRCVLLDFDSDMLSLPSVITKSLGLTSPELQPQKKTKQEESELSGSFCVSQALFVSICLHVKNGIHI